MTHPTWELPVEENGAALVLMPCPGTKEVSITDTLAQLKAQGVSAVVTALSTQELEKHGLSRLPAEIEKAGLLWVHTAIEDDAAPTEDFLVIWKQNSPLLHDALNKGEKVAMHCMGGSGRTGLLAAHLLLEKNWPLEDIITKVQALRPGAFTKAAQIDYIHNFAAK